MLKFRKKVGGFTLPTVIIASVVMMALLAVSMQLVSTVSNTSRDQYYSLLAREAAESGLKVARACLESNGGVPQWSDEKPLTPKTDCSGDNVPANPDHVASSGQVVSHFKVPGPRGVAPNYIFDGEGIMEQRSLGDGSTVKTVSITLKMSVPSDEPSAASGWLGPKINNNGEFQLRSFNGNDDFYLFLKSDGTVWAWGGNMYGLVGDGTLTKRFTPLQVASDVKKIARVAGYANPAPISYTREALIIKNDNSLWSWGSTQPRIGSVQPKPAQQIMTDVAHVVDPDVVRHGPGVHSTSVGVFDSVFVIKTDGTLWGWGDNSHGSLGVGSTTNVAVPTQILTDVKKVYQHTDTTYAIRGDDSLWAWGENNDGRLGVGNAVDRLTPVKVMDDIDSLYLHSIFPTVYAVTKDGTLWAWGRNSEGQIGDNSTTGRRAPVNVTDNVKEVFHRGMSVSVLKNDDSLWSWGNNSGNIELGFYGTRRVPTLVANDVQSYDGETSFFKNDNSLWVWGDNSRGQLCTGNKLTAYSPVQFTEEVSRFIGLHGISYFIKPDDSLWGCGGNTARGYQLGLGYDTDRTTPTHVMNDIADISYGTSGRPEMGSSGSYVLKTDNSLWYWGSNSYSEIPGAPSSGVWPPLQVASNVYRHVAFSHSIYRASYAVDTSGGLWVWGRPNANGFLGVGYTGPVPTPTKILQDTKPISSGSDAGSGGASKYTIY